MLFTSSTNLFIFNFVCFFLVPRKVLLEKYEEEPDSTEYSFLEEVDQEDILDNPKSLAPSPNITNKKNYDNGDKSNAILLYHSPSENDYEYNYKGKINWTS